MIKHTAEVNDSSRLGRCYNLNHEFHYYDYRGGHSVVEPPGINKQAKTALQQTPSPPPTAGQAANSKICMDPFNCKKNNAVGVNLASGKIVPRPLAPIKS